MLLSKQVAPNRTARFCAVLFALVVLVTFTCGVNADVWNKKTVMTFNEPVEVAGEVLPAGTYVFKLVGSSSNRHIVQILNEEENHVYKTILAIPKERMRPTGKTEVSFDERPSGQPQALRAWFYPGDLTGQEFVTREYPGTMVAKATPVATPIAPTTIDTTPSAVTTPAEETKSEASQPADTEPSPEPAPFVDEQAQEPQAQPKTPEAPKEESGEKLPQTASYLPLAGLAGLSSLGAAVVLRLIRKGKA